jgi:hypothetical protein
MHQNGAFVHVLKPQEMKLDLTQASISAFSRRIQVQLSAQPDLQTDKASRLVGAAGGAIENLSKTLSDCGAAP